MKKTLDQEKQIQMILSEISQIKDGLSDKKIEKILNNVQKELSILAVRQEENRWLLKDYLLNYKNLQKS